MSFSFVKKYVLGTFLAMAFSGLCLSACTEPGENGSADSGNRIPAQDRAENNYPAEKHEEAQESEEASAGSEKADGYEEAQSPEKTSAAGDKADWSAASDSANRKNDSGRKSDKGKKHSKKKAESADKKASGKSNRKGTDIAEGTKVSDRSKISMATWNLENFFDTNDDYYKDEVLSERQYGDKLNRLGSVIKGINADIVGVQEIETQGCLEDLAERSGYPYIVFYPGNDKIRGINVGVMSKIPIRNYVSHAKDRFGSNGSRGAFSRDCLEVHFKHTSNFTLLVNHLKSKLGGEESDAKRFQQAQRVVEIAEGLQSLPVAICGDLNDEPDSKALKPLTTCPFLTDVLGHLPRERRLSFFSKRYKSALDYIFVNNRLKPAIVPGSARVYNTQEAGAASDHRPVRVDFDLSKIK